MYSEFLQTVVSPSGYNCITEMIPKPDGTGVWAVNRPAKFSDTVATDGLINHIMRQGNAVYFGLGAYANLNDKGNVVRSQDSVVALRSFWLDIDAGESKYSKHGDKAYRTQQEAIDALYAVVAKGALPVPTYVVSSGEGLHVYWCATEDVAPAVWKPLASRLGKYCSEVGLRVDPSRTADHASVLRPVGTLHQSSGRTVSILQTNRTFTSQELLSAMQALPVTDTLMAMQSAHTLHNSLGLPPTNTAMAAYAAQSSMGGMAQYPAASFGKIIERQEYTHDGCRQLYHCYTHQAEIPEPLWYKALSVAQFCSVDRDEWVHRMSHQHPKYERGETERKAMQAKGPASCQAFELENPDGCKGCPHYGKPNGNPIVIGYNPQNRPTIVIAPVSADKTQTDKFLIPELPTGFHRRQEGGVYTYVPKVMPDGKKSKDELDEFCILANDMYMFERVRDGSNKQLYLCRYHSPHDGVVEFQLSSDTIHTVGKEFKDAITGAGLPIHGNERWSLLMTFLNLSRTRLIGTRAAVDAVTQMGWQPDGKEFVLGDVVLTRIGTRPAPLGDRAVARKYAKAYQPSAKGEAMDEELQVWNSTLQAMYGNPKAVANQFVIATALGAPFSTKFALESHAGGVISLSSSGSGRGKTFTCQTALRVFGDPTAVTFSSKDGTTINALMTNLGYLNSLPLLRDEITEMSSDEVVGMVYDSTRLGDKERAQGSDNDIRENKSHWRTFFYATGNTSMYDMMTANRDVADGPTRRVTEINIPELEYLQDSERARRLARTLHGIKGVAGYRLLEWIVRNEAAAQKLWEDTMTYFIREHHITNEERYWCNHLVSGCVGALIGDQLGLLPFEPSGIFRFAGELLSQLRGRVGYRVVAQTDYFAQFMTDNTDHNLIVGTMSSDENVVTVPELPRKAVYIRTETSNKMVYINNVLIKQWCSARKIVLADFEMELRKRGGKPAQTKRMLANTAHARSTEPQKVWAVPIGDNS